MFLVLEVNYYSNYKKQNPLNCVMDVTLPKREITCFTLYDTKQDPNYELK